MNEYELYLEYMKEINKYPLLTNKQEQELGKRAQKGDKEAINTLINANLRLVVKIAFDQPSSNLHLLDYIQEGNIALLQAAQKYDPNKKVKFSAYAGLWIREYMLRYTIDNMHFLRLPRYHHRRLVQYYRIRNEYMLKFNEEPSIEYVAQQLGITPYELNKLLSVLSNISLDKEYSDDSRDREDTLYDLIPTDSYGNLEREEERIWLEELKEELSKTIDKVCTPKEKEILYLRYFRNMTQEMAGAEYGVSKQAVSQNEIRALKKIKENYKLVNWLEA